jgi:hypothetical protein
MEIDWQEIQGLLFNFDFAHGGLWNCWRYILLLFAILVMLLPYSKDDVRKPGQASKITYLMAYVIISIFMDTVEIFNIIRIGGGPHQCNLFSYLLRVVQFVCFIVAAGITPKSPAKIPAVVGGVLSVVYTFGRWMTEMNVPPCSEYSTVPGM